MSTEYVHTERTEKTPQSHRSRKPAISQFGGGLGSNISNKGSSVGTGGLASGRCPEFFLAAFGSTGGTNQSGMRSRALTSNLAELSLSLSLEAGFLGLSGAGGEGRLNFLCT